MAAFENALVELVPRLRIYARSLTRNRDDADDLVQETLQRALSRRHYWKPEIGIRAWLFTIMHNTHINIIRATMRRPAEVDHTEVEWLPELTERPKQMAGLELRAVAQAYARLSDEQREVLYLVAVEAMAYRDVASALDIPIGTVMSRLSRARQALQRDVETP